MENNNIDLVTVVTVVYNAEDLLEETIVSVVNQSYEHIEYIIIDGSSTDNTIKIIKNHEEKLAYWITEPDEGIYFAMNKAIKKATGEWINFMNAGDTFVDNTTMQKVIDGRGEDTELIYGDHICDGVIGSVKDRKITRSMPSCHQSLFVKTALMKQYPFNTLYSISSDYEFLLNMYKLGKKFQYIEEPIANYRRDGFSDQNQARWYLENLTIMMNHHIDLDEILQSPAYNLIENKKLFDTQKKLDYIYSLISDFFSTKLYKNPFAKLKSAKRLYLFYKSSLK